MQTPILQLDGRGLNAKVDKPDGNLRAFMSESGIFYYDENQNVVWSTDCAPNC